MQNDKIFKTYQERIDHFLNSYLPSEGADPIELHKAMRYSVLNGGKRIRALLTYLSGELINADLNVLDRVASAVELIHAFSLIHDDLPALDNDDLRRGKPSCHIAFGEYTAILAGDALHSMAFEMLARLRKKQQVSNKSCLEMIELLSHGIGSKGMAGGEYLDLSIKNLKGRNEISILEKIYKLKTGKFLLTSILLGLLAGNCHDKDILMHMSRFGLYIGIAFQIHDDILEVESDTETLGKSNMSDLTNGNPTYISLADLEFAKEEEHRFYDNALEHLQRTGLSVGRIAQLSDYIIRRLH